ncbi:MAG: hypothetical protein U0164_04460 [Gemmatimonadaceae bacterium]
MNHTVTLTVTSHTGARPRRVAAAKLLLLGSILTFAACRREGGANGTSVQVVSDSALGALPTVSVSDGMLVCTALGGDACPLRGAVANWLTPERVVVWEPGRPVMLLDKENPTGKVVGSFGDKAGQYTYATAVGMLEGRLAIVDMQRTKLVRYKEDQTFDREDNIPRPDENAAPGFAGSTPVLQSIGADGDSGVAHLRVRILRSQTELGGTKVLDLSLPWLRLKGRDALEAMPLFPAMPRYAIDADQSIVWTPADSFLVQRRSFDGKVEWTLSSDRAGVEVTDQDITRRRDEISRKSPEGTLKPGELDSMQARTPKRHPVLGGIILEPKGRLLLAGAATPSRDSVDYIVTEHSGRPTHRFVLPGRTHVLLFAGDSLLVHRPTEGEPWELRWLKLGFSK